HENGLHRAPEPTGAPTGAPRSPVQAGSAAPTERPTVDGADVPLVAHASPHGPPGTEVRLAHPHRPNLRFSRSPKKRPARHPSGAGPDRGLVVPTGRPARDRTRYRAAAIRACPRGSRPAGPATGRGRTAPSRRRGSWSRAPP